MATSNTVNPPGTVYVISTSHMDWDWLGSFEQYYNTGVTDCTPEHISVRYILEQALTLINNNPPFQYNLAEVAWLKRYMQDNPDVRPTPDMVGKLFFLGGGLTSPDNLVCNGEAFIRNYLEGRNYIKQLGLGALLTNVCWIPDDFGHDPQLPVVLNAMGLNGVSFWRVPGNEPQPPTQYQPTDGSTALSTQLEEKGVTFFWQAADKSKILAQQMYNGYGMVVSDETTKEQISADINTLVTQQYGSPPVAVNQPGRLYMYPCGGDFSLPTKVLLDALQDYTDNYYPSTNVTAVLGTFQDYINAMNSYNADQPATSQLAIRKDFDASNDWTGHFASRVQLKINQQCTVNNLLAAETLSTLLHAFSSYSASVLRGLQQGIGTSWESLLPSTHHDYVNGTASDNVYWTEQLPLIETALGQSSTVLSQAMKLLGSAVKPKPQNGEIPYVVFNPSGFSRSAPNCLVGNLVEIEMSASTVGIQSYRIPGTPDITGPVQVLKNGNLVFPYEGIGSITYGCVYLSKDAVSEPVVEPVVPSDKYTFANEMVQVTITRDTGWAITSIMDIARHRELLSGNDLGNQLLMYYEKPINPVYTPNYGNLYQMGNELYPTSQPISADGINVDGFYADTTSVFCGQEGELLENGPYRWHFRGKVYNYQNDVTMTVEYFLDYNEPLVRIKVTGQAAPQNTTAFAITETSPNTVVTSWTINDKNGNQPAGMNYGTGNHWNGAGFKPYWNGPTFRSTHDFLTLTEKDRPQGAPLAAVYHKGMRAWSLTGNKLLGILFRNAPGTNRGADGTDTAVHTQEYAFRLPGVQDPASSQPLQEAIAFQQPLLVTPAVTTNYSLNTMAETKGLAAIEGNAIIRVARTQPGSGDNNIVQGPVLQPLPFSFVLRIYQPSNETGNTWTLDVPNLSAPQVSLVTALEDPLTVPDPPTFDSSTLKVTIPSMPTLTTLRIYTCGITPGD